MKILLYSKHLEAAQMPRILEQEGATVYTYVEQEDARETLTGIVDFIDDWTDKIDEVDVVVFDDVNNGKLQDFLRSKGYKVWGGSAFADKLECDRHFASELFKKAGLSVPDSINFKSYEEAISYVTEHPGRYCLKPNASVDKALTKVCKFEDGSDTIATLKTYEKKWPKNVPMDFELQTFVKGIGEIGIGGFFNGNDWVRSPSGKVVCEIDQEYKPLFNGDIGPSTGEVGSVTFMVEEPPMFFKTLDKLTPALRKTKYVGEFALNFILTEDGTLWVLEATARLGYPITWEHDTMHKTKWSELFMKSANGENNFLEFHKGFCIAVVVHTPPFPQEMDHNPHIGAPILFEKKMTPEEMLKLKNFYFMEVSIEDDQLVTAGHNGYAVIVTAMGDSIDKARDLVYKRVDLLTMDGKGYRTDIGEKTKEILPQLKKFGYI